MKKKTNIFWLIVLMAAGSFVTFYTTNLIMSDVSNMFYGVHNADCISSFPGFIFALETVIATIFLIRVTRRPGHKKKITELYAALFVALSALGIACAVYTGLVVYDSFLAPYPFAGYTVISLVVHALIVALGIACLARTKKNMPDDAEKKKTTFGHIVFSLLVFLGIFYTYNRLGALMWGVTYIQGSTLWLTFPFYLSLLLPVAMMIFILLYVYGKFNGHPVAAVVYDAVLLAADIALGAAVFGTGAVNTQFISAISPALALERLWTKPIDNIVHFIVLLIVGIYFLIMAIKLCKAKPVRKHAM